MTDHDRIKRMAQEAGDWSNTSELARDVMNGLGDFSPTVRAGDCMVKGHMASEYGEDGRTYWTSDDLRRIAQACNEVADWLDARHALTPLHSEAEPG